MTSRAIRALGLLLATALAAAPAEGAGIGPYPGYTGAKFPASAAALATLPRSPFDNGSPVDLSYFLDTTGDRRADVAHSAPLNASAVGVLAVLAAYVSPSNSDVVYALVVPAGGGPYQVHTYRRTSADGWERLAATAIPSDIYALRGQINTPAIWGFEAGHVHLAAFRRIAGGDWILVVGASRSSGFRSRFALLRDGADADPYADTWSSPVEIPATEAMTLDGRGRIIARRILDASNTNNNAGFLRVVDTDGDGLPDAADEQSFAPATGLAFGAYGPADVDLGADRFHAGYSVYKLDSRGRPVPGSARNINDTCTAGGCGFGYEMFQIWAGRDGSPVIFGRRTPNTPEETPDVLAHYDDLNFDGQTGNHHSSNPFEVREIVRDSVLPVPDMRSGHVAELTELSFSGAWASAAFSSFGVYPGGESFRFRMGGRDFDQFTVSKAGLLSFVGQVSAPASLNGLQQSHGVLAPAWSDGWDTSEVRVFAGYAPANTSFVDGGRVLAFAVEWRGLRLPGWEAGRQISVRLLMYDDGSFRTDFGAFEASELGAHRFVVGYAGPGNHQQTGSIRLIDHSWGSPPVGLGSERVVAEEFGSSNMSSVGHAWVRWTGYPERLDTATPPQIINARLVDGEKISMASAGSNIQAGARLLVDGVESFSLTLNTRGTKWVVKASQRSTPGGRSVRSIWRDGQAHTIVVINPDEERSAPVQLR